MSTVQLGPAPGTAANDPDCTLVKYVENVYFVEHELAGSSRYQMRYAVTSFQDYLKHVPRVRDLTDEVVNQYLVWLTEQPYTAETIRSKRRYLLTVWRAAWYSGTSPTQPGRIRAIKARRQIPKAWSTDQIAKLLSVVRSLRGRFVASNVPRRWFWESFIRTGFDTGLRLGDLMRLRRADIRQDGVLVLVQGKTGQPVTAQLYPETLAAIGETFPPERETIFAAVLSRSHIIRNFPVLLKAAGLQGSVKYLRRSCASFAELTAPGTAGRRLGHSTPEMAMRHYVDPFISTARRELPPNPLTAAPEQHPAIVLHAAWEAKERIEPADLADLLRKLDTTQTAVSIALGKSPTWLNAILKGRENLSDETAQQLREFVRQQAEAAGGANQ